jgi:MYXO-CTERM domain-containing protein
MTRIVPLGLLGLLALNLDVPVAHACSDAGPPNNYCEGATGEWLDCESHADCPGDQVCDPNGHCACNCQYGEMCEGEVCRCADRPDPVVPDGCELEVNPCGDAVVRCPPGDAGPPEVSDPCHPDGGDPESVPAVCREPKGDEGGGCAAGGGAPSGFVLGSLGALLARRRRR